MGACSMTSGLHLFQPCPTAACSKPFVALSAVLEPEGEIHNDTLVAVTVKSETVSSQAHVRTRGGHSSGYTQQAFTVAR